MNRAEVCKIPLKQLALLLVAAALISLFDGNKAASLVVGGLVAITAQAYFTLCAFRYQGARAGKAIVRGFYRGESGKFVLTLIGFAAVFLFLPQLNSGMIFGGYIAMQVVQLWLINRAMK